MQIIFILNIFYHLLYKGLFLGFSVLSSCELLDLAINIIASLFKKNQIKQKSMVNAKKSLEVTLPEAFVIDI